MQKKQRKYPYETKAARLRKRSLVRRWCENCGQEVMHEVTDGASGWEWQRCMGCQLKKSYRTK